MALEYKTKSAIGSIMPVLDEYIGWYNELLRSYFDKKISQRKPTQIFTEWLEQARQNGLLHEEAAKKIQHIEQGMMKAAESFAARAEFQDIPIGKYFRDLSGHYEEFIAFMRRMEKDHVAENSGFDLLTGLRSPKVMAADLQRELDRLSRRGNPFSIALVKINEYAPEWSALPTFIDALIVKIADRMLYSLRSFDDAYYLGDEYFLLSLKHADTIGSNAAVNRLNNAIKLANISRPDDPGRMISLVTVVAEPSAGDNVDALLANMKKDLDGINASGTVVQYNDISPLQRYIHSIEQTK